MYEANLSHDFNSNLTSIDDRVQHGFGVDLELDGLDRIKGFTEGMFSQGALLAGYEEREENWQLDQLGNWSLFQRDLDGDGAYGGPGDLHDIREHNLANEVLTRDTDGDLAVDRSLQYDQVGSVKDDGGDFTYEYDPWRRLRRMRSKSDDKVVAEYRYNGLGYRIAELSDTNRSGEADSADTWHYFAYNENWQRIATFVGGNPNPLDEFVYGAAGLGGFGGTSELDQVVLRDRDADLNGTAEERLWYRWFNPA